MSLDDKIEKIKLLLTQIQSEKIDGSNIIEEADYLLSMVFEDTKRIAKLITNSSKPISNIHKNSINDNLINQNLQDNQQSVSNNDFNSDLSKLCGEKLDLSFEENIDAMNADDFMQDICPDDFSNDLTNEDILKISEIETSNLDIDSKFDSDDTDDEKFESHSQNEKYLDCLKKYFGYSDFKPLQWKIIDSVLNKRRDNCVVMSTGYGKSLCYQFPSVFTNRCSIIISPLISLMEDQVMGLSAVNISSCLLGSAQQNMVQAKQDILNGKIKIVYMAPEFAVSANDILTEINNKIGIDVLAIDEAHCVSQWGNDFRTSYRSLGSLRDILKGVPIMALTATATPEVRRDICKSLRLVAPIMTCTGFDRPNLFLSVQCKSHSPANDLKSHLVQTKGRHAMFDGATIIYCPTKKSAEEIETILRTLNCSCALYHAGLPLPLRKKNHHMFINDQINVVVATVAFGMGIDKPDVRNVIHYGAPKDIESYYQEIGRAGRDGLPSKCIVYYSTADFNTNRYFLSQIKSPTFLKHKEEMMKKMEQYLSSTKCRRVGILSHFDDKTIGNGMAKINCCDNCEASLMGGPDVTANNRKDLTKEAKLLFESIQLLGGRFGLTMPIMLLRGSSNQKLNPTYRSNKLFGKGKDKSEKWWKTFARQLISEDFLSETMISGSFGSTVDITEKAEKWLKDGATEFFLNLNKELLEFEQENIRPTYSYRPADSTQLVTSSSVAVKEKVIVDTRVEKLQMELYTQLISIRNEMSQTTGLYSFNIFSNKILADMSKYRPTTIEDLYKIDDVAVEKANKYGQEFVAFICKFAETNDLSINVLAKQNIQQSSNISHSNPNLSQTCQETYDLFQMQKLSLDKVAQIRTFKASTLVSHLCSCISYGMPVDVHRLGVSNEDQSYIYSVISRPPINNDVSRLVPIKEQLPNHTFDQIRICIALLKNNQISASTNSAQMPQSNDTNFSHSKTDIKLIDTDKNIAANSMTNNDARSGSASQSFSQSSQVYVDVEAVDKKRKLPDWMVKQSRATNADTNGTNKKSKNGIFK